MPTRIMTAIALLALAACQPSTRPRSASEASSLEESNPDGSETPDFREVAVASIDSPSPTPGPELRMARIELARQGGDLLGGHLAIALTGDPATPEILIRGLGDIETCQEAATALAFLPRHLAPRPLWLALRLDCSSQTAQAAAVALGLEPLVELARRDEELPSPAPAAEPEVEAPDRCAALATTLSSPTTAEAPLPTAFAQLAQGPWQLPTTDDEVCGDPSLAAAIRLRRGDRTVRLALDLLLGGPEVLPPHLITFVSRFGLGAASPRLADRVDEASGVLCAALIEAGQFETTLPLLREEPSTVPLCLLLAAEALSSRDDQEALTTLRAIAGAARHEGCEAGALSAARTLLDRGERPPRWTADPTVLGRALSATLRQEPQDAPSPEQLQELRALAARFNPGEDPAPDQGPVRLLQRDLRTVLSQASGARRSALQLLLETGGR